MTWERGKCSECGKRGSCAQVGISREEYELFCFVHFVKMVREHQVHRLSEEFA